MFLSLLNYLRCRLSKGNKTNIAHCDGGNDTSKRTAPGRPVDKVQTITNNKFSTSAIASSGVLLSLALLLWGLSVLTLYHRHRLLRMALSSTAASTAAITTATMETPPAASTTTTPCGTPTEYQIHVIVDDDDDDDNAGNQHNQPKNDHAHPFVIGTEYYRDILGSQPADDEWETSSRNFVNISMDGVWWMEALHPAPTPTKSTLSFSHTQ
eukprot:jgi/Psemu1/57022/gm1.57022_g